MFANGFLVDLADAGARQLLDESDLVGHRVARDVARLGRFRDGGLDLVGRGRLPRLEDDHRQRTLAPLVVLHPDHGDLADRRVLGDDVFELERGHPLAAGLDHVLQTVGHLQAAGRVDGPDVAGMEVAAGPQLVRCGRVVQVAHGQPRRADDDLAGALAVTGGVEEVAVDGVEIDQRHRIAGADALVGLAVQIPPDSVGTGWPSRR